MNDTTKLPLTSELKARRERIQETMRRDGSTPFDEGRVHELKHVESLLTSQSEGDAAYFMRSIRTGMAAIAKARRVCDDDDTALSDKVEDALHEIETHFMGTLICCENGYFDMPHDCRKQTQQAKDEPPLCATCNDKHMIPQRGLASAWARCPDCVVEDGSWLGRDGKRWRDGGRHG